MKSSPFFRWIRIGGIAAAVAVAAALGFLILRGTPELVISARDGRILAELPVRNGRFDHVFVHSVHRSKVVERFRIVRDAWRPRSPVTLRLYELRYDNEGVGMPTDAEEGYRLVDGHFVLAMDRRFASIPIFVSVVPGHGVQVDGVFLPFVKWAPPGELIILSGRTSPLLRAWR